jgi:hypothetical protein
VDPAGVLQTYGEPRHQAQSVAPPERRGDVNVPGLDPRLLRPAASAGSGTARTRGRRPGTRALAEARRDASREAVSPSSGVSPSAAWRSGSILVGSLAFQVPCCAALVTTARQRLAPRVISLPPGPRRQGCAVVLAASTWAPAKPSGRLPGCSDRPGGPAARAASGRGARCARTAPLPRRDGWSARIRIWAGGAGPEAP